MFLALKLAQKTSSRIWCSLVLPHFSIMHGTLFVASKSNFDLAFGRGGGGVE
jgi:hypothetical protein